MNKNEVKTFGDLKNVVEHIAESVDNMSICILGDPKKPGDLGMRGDVRNNKRWRNNVNKWLGVFGVSTLGLLLKEGFSFLKRGG